MNDQRCPFCDHQLTAQCPVCRKTVTPTQSGAIRWHRDTAGKHCPMSRRPFTLITESSVA